MTAFDPDWCVPPGRILDEWLEERSMSVRVAAVAAGEMSQETLEGIICGDVELTLELACRLALLTGISAPFWVRAEDLYRQGLAKGKSVLG